MPTIKQKVSISPIRSFEAGISTFLDKSKYEIVYMNIHQKDIKEKYARKVYGQWCCPLKICVAMEEQIVIEKDVKKVFGLGIQTCHYPFVLGNPEKWINKKFEYYPIEAPNLCMDLTMIYYFNKQLRKALPEINLISFLFKTPLGIYRGYLSHKMYNLHLKNLPLSKNPKESKLIYEKYNKKLVEVEGYKNSSKILKEFENDLTILKIKDKPKHKILLTGDFSIFIMEFFLFELDIFLAKNNIEIIQPFSPFTSISLVKYSSAMRKSRKLLKKHFSNNVNKVNTRDRFVVENITLAQIMKGLEENVDGIIYIKPLMCTPCDNISYIIKNEKHFNLPFVEISYDEHSGINGIMTRLEAFINIIEERKK